MRSRLSGRAALAQLTVFICVGLTGCAPPPAVATFAQQASLVLQAGNSVTDDLAESCERRHSIGQPLPQVTLLAPASAPKLTVACERFRQESIEITQVSKLVSRYFSALEELSRFNTVTVSDPAGVAGANASAVANLGSIQSDSVGKLASILTLVITERYRRGRTVQLLRDADSSVSAILTGLEQIAGSDYVGLLEEEARTNANTFREAGLNQSPSVILLLNRAYREEVASGQRRSNAAGAYVAALHEIAEGHAALTKLGWAKSGNMTTALAPHISQLQRLLPALTANIQD